MKYLSVLFLLFLFAFSLIGCYVYTQEPPPAVIIVPGDTPPSPSPPPPPPAGAVGPAR